MPTGHRALPPSTPLKRWLDAHVPFIYRPARTVWERYKAFRFRRRYARLTRAVIGRCGWVVQSGPFRGMRYVQESCSSPQLPKIMGTYEAEVHEVIAQAVRHDYAL